MANGLTRADLGPLRLPWDVGTLAGLDDRSLLARFVGRPDVGTDLAFEVLVRRHGPMVTRVCSQLLGDRHAAEDAFQAVFVVLARRAGSIRKPEQLAPWLHGVALRTAKESRSREVRRRRLERRGAILQEKASSLPERPLIRLEEAEALHGEIDRLPERYRSPVVLCDLEGLTHQEAAARLRCPTGTVAIRLKRARERLRERLARRGLDPTAGLWAATLQSTSATIPSSGLIEATVRASTTAGAASPSVASLAQGVLTAMTIAKCKVAGATLALGLVATWGATFGLQAPVPAGRKGDPAPVVPVRKIERAALREVRDFEEFLGRIESSRIVEIRAGVGGILEKALVQDGAKVKAKDILFEIDPKPFQAGLELAEAQVLKSRSQRQLALTVKARNARLLAKNPDLVSQQERDKAEKELTEITNAFQAATQSESAAKTALDETTIKAPFDGEVIRRAEKPVEVAQAGHTSLMTLPRAVNPGNAIKAGETVLARLVAIDPMAVAFEVDERTVLKLRRLYGDDKAKAVDDLVIRVALLDEQEFSLLARLESLPDRLDPATGTGRSRATIPNPDGLILAGMVARVRLTTSKPREALVVPQSSLMTGEKGATLYVVDERDLVEERVVKLGQLHGEVRVIREGLKAGDRVIAGDLSGVRPGTTFPPPAASIPKP